MSTSRVKGDVLALDPGTLPAAGSQANELRNDSASGDLKRWDATLLAWVPVGSGGGGGSSILWKQFPGGAPLNSFDAQGDDVYLFDDAVTTGQKLRTTVKVPESYQAGTQIFLKFLAYSPSSANNWQFTAEVYLVRKTTGVIDNPTDFDTEVSGDLTNVAINRLREVTIPLTSATGLVDVTAVGAGDLLQIELYRGIPGGGDDTQSIRMYPGTTEILFS